MSAQSKRRCTPMKPCIFAIVLLFVSRALAQHAAPVFQGDWSATLGPAQTAGPAQTFRGTWVGQTLSGRPNSAHGSWGLFSDTGQLVLQGTWSAQKTAGGWHGTWTARILHGRPFSGTWKADMTGSSGKTFQDVLERTLEAEVPGSWRSGQQEGNWWLKGLRDSRP
jgi:hypothetical protein